MQLFFLVTTVLLIVASSPVVPGMHATFFSDPSFPPIVLCKDSWEDFTELVEQMQMLDEFKGAYGGFDFISFAPMSTLVPPPSP